MQVGRRVAAEPKAGVKTSCLSMYSVPPQEQLSVTEFEEFAYDRLRLLNVIDMARAKGLKGTDLEKAIRKGRDDCMPNTPAGMKKDRFSHFILRLAYCRSEDLRRWFLQNEVELFKWRFVNNPPDNMNEWLKGHSMNYAAISKDEATTLKPYLLAAFLARPHPKESDPTSLFERQEHYKVEFEQVLDLVRQRRVYLHRGFAYVPASDLVSIVANQVRMHLSKQLSSMARAWPALREEESERLSSFLESLATQYVGDDYSQPRNGGVKVSIADLPMLSRRSFPLCMANQHAKLGETHHLKNDARNQFGLFLKGIGLTYEESYAYWRAEFSKNITGEKFDKEYRYGIRYQYGLEGKRQDWSPHSCAKIINGPGSNAAAGLHHGCPFKNFDETQLRVTLQQLQVANSEISSIVDKVKGQHYQIACGKYFEAKHKGSTLIETELGGISHPNQYFEQSSKFYAEKELKDQAALDQAKASKATPAADAVMAQA
jgi:DNA primase large subunit